MLRAFFGHFVRGHLVTRVRAGWWYCVTCQEHWEV